MGIVRLALDHWVDPPVAWQALVATEPFSFWLDSGTDASNGTSYLGAGSSVISHVPSVRLSGEGSGFELGWVGWIGYEHRASTMGEPVPAPAEVALIDADWALAFDHASRTVEVLARDAGLLDVVRARLAVATSVAPASKPADRAATWAHGDGQYLAMIRECQRAITDGDAYQLCLTTSATVSGDVDPFSTYIALRASSPTHHGGLVVVGDTALLSASPEQFLAVSTTGLVSTSPIKGTRPRSIDPIEDAALADQLRSSDKERAENLMIVDLMRNDIGRISEVGTVNVPSLLKVESYANVHQLVSTVTGQLSEGLTAADAVASTFPAGSMTGAPKLSATRILARLEGRPRGIYSGAFGYLSLNGSVDLAMVIRSIVVRPGEATVGAGGGITALSVPEDELAEVKLKAAPLLSALGVG